MAETLIRRTLSTTDDPVGRLVRGVFVALVAEARKTPKEMNHVDFADGLGGGIGAYLGSICYDPATKRPSEADTRILMERVIETIRTQTEAALRGNIFTPDRPH